MISDTDGWVYIINMYTDDDDYIHGLYIFKVIIISSTLF